MKKLWSEAKAKRHVLTRQRYVEKCRQYRPKRQAQRPKLRLVAPRHFSLIDNPDETVNFLNRIRSVGVRYDIFVDLSEVTILSCDAIAVLNAAVNTGDVRAEGNQPGDPHLRQMLIESGFYEHVRSQTKDPDRARGKMTRFNKKQDRGVNGLLASNMIDFANGRLGRTVDKPTYAVLGEVMGNTFDHASDAAEGQLQWWATVYCNLESGKACYSFVDLGIGIIHSKSFRQRVHYLFNAGIGGDAEQLRALLNRKIPSRSGLPYRGKGLPWVYDTCCAGRISNFTIIANHVYARPADGVYKKLDNHFHGTFLYWET